MVKRIGAKESKTKDKVLTRKVLFEFLSPEAREVHIAGEFNRWDTHANMMKRDKGGIWRTTLALKAGRYEYRLLVDGNWENVPSCSGCVPNVFGTQNCVKIVE
jgi:1,4-alpha-glucan branching enzyme